MRANRFFLVLILMVAAVAAFGAYDGTKPADNEYVADVPALVRENQRALKDDAIVNAGTLSGYSVGSASGNIPRNDGSLNINLNSDKLDNKEATDFTATSTFTAHENDTSTHGVAQVAGIADVNNAISAANASDTLNLRLDGSRAMTGNLKFSGNYGILQSTSDGADSGYVFMSGGGDISATRGGFFSAIGNEYPTYGGMAQIHAGNVSTGHIGFYTAAVGRMFLTYGGNLGIGTDSPSKRLTVGTGSGNECLNIYAGNTGFSSLYFSDALSSTGEYEGVVQYNHSTNNMEFYTNHAEAARILSSGRILIGTTSDDGTNKLQVNGSASIGGALSLSGGIAATRSVNGEHALAVVNPNTGSGAYAQVTVGTGVSSHVGGFQYLGSGYTGTPEKVNVFASTQATGGMGILVQANAPVTFATNNTERMRIAAGGNVLIDSTSDDGSSKLQVNGSIKGSLLVSTGLAGGGTVDVGANNAGTLVVLVSDARLKKDVRTIEGALDKVAKLRGVTFNWIDREAQNLGTQREIGLIAQEVAPIVPEAIRTTQDGTMTVTYSKLVALAFEAIKELNEKVARRLGDNAALARRIGQQQKQIDRQQAEIDELKRIVAKLAK